MDKIKGFLIVEIIKIAFGDTLLELYFNLCKDSSEVSFKCGITDDGETIFYEQNDWITPSDLKNEIYSKIIVDQSVVNDELKKLIGSEILNLEFGIGKELISSRIVIYYLKVSTTVGEFLFFNNGDEGSYCFDNTNDIVTADKYDIAWTNTIPKTDL